MLRQRVLTAIALLALLAVVLGSESLLAFRVTLAVFFAAAVWESLRLFEVRTPLPMAVMGGIFLLILASGPSWNWKPLAMLCALIWAIRFFPALKLGLPSLQGARGLLFVFVFMIALLGCFVSIAAVFEHSPVYLVSAMAIVWVADIGAYFAGRKFGRRKLAPEISPGKTWEGAIGGWLAVLVLFAASVFIPALSDTFAAQLVLQRGWPLWIIIMSVLVAASVIGDLFESLMKRRAGMKDSSQLLPGHGGVLDRIDALIPVMPLVLLLTTQS
jgi:phosphatidate cytidylyltransferase